MSADSRTEAKTADTSVAVEDAAESTAEKPELPDTEPESAKADGVIPPPANDDDAVEPETLGADTRSDDGDETRVDRRWPRRLATVALIVVTITAVACAIILGWMLKNARDVDSAAEQARATARDYAVTLTSVSSDGLDQNFADVLDGATGEFKDMYAQSSEQLRQLLVDNNASAKGTVVEDGIKSATKTKVEVLLFVDQAVTNAMTPEPRMDRSRVVMTMELVDGRWLASKVELP